jgi:hypothetical protein
MPRITNNAQLRNDLLDAYESLKADPRRLNQVSELANTAGKVLASAKMEIEYQLYRKKITGYPEIKFMEGDK